MLGAYRRELLGGVRPRCVKIGKPKLRLFRGPLERDVILADAHLSPLSFGQQVPQKLTCRLVHEKILVFVNDLGSENAEPALFTLLKL